MRKAPIKILYVIARLNIGGPAEHVILLASRLKKKGYEPILAKGQVGCGEEEMSDLLIREGVTPVEISGLGRELSWRDDWSAFFQIRQLIRRFQPDIVHTHTAKAGTLARLAARSAGVPILLHTFHGHVFRGYFGRIKTACFLLIERLLATLTDCIVTVGERQRREILEFGISSPEKVVSIPLGLELEPFWQNPELVGLFKEELGLDRETRLVGVIARFAPIKGHRIFLDAVPKILNVLPRTHFVFVGDGELRERLKNQAERLRIAHAVHFVGYRRDLPKIYASLDLVVLPSLNEGLPTVLIEAIAAGCYAVATDVGSVGDLIRTEDAGILIPPGSPAALAKAVIRSLKEGRIPAEQEQRRVLQEYGVDRFIEDMDGLYRTLWGKRTTQ